MVTFNILVYKELITKIFEELKNLDRIGIPEKGESESEDTVS